MELFLVSVEVCHFRLMWLPWFVSSGLGMYVCMYVCMYVGIYFVVGVTVRTLSIGVPYIYDATMPIP